MFKAFIIFTLDFAGDGQADLPASQNQEQISEYKCSFTGHLLLGVNISVWGGGLVRSHTISARG